jgi:hypothetical protein
MGTPLSRWRIALDLKLMTDVQLLSLCAAIQKMSASSTLMTNTSIAASVAALAKKGPVLTSGNEAVAADEKQLKADILVRDNARQAVQLELSSLKGLVLNNATAATDITGIGYALAAGQPATRVAPAAPPASVNREGKIHGNATATVPTTERGRFVAQACAPSSTGAPAGPWSSLPGNGKQRKLTGATGTQVWVQFAKVRYGLQGPWSTPVLVTFP